MDGSTLPSFQVLQPELIVQEFRNSRFKKVFVQTFPGNEASVWVCKSESLIQSLFVWLHLLSGWVEYFRIYNFECIRPVGLNWKMHGMGTFTESDKCIHFTHITQFKIFHIGTKWSRNRHWRTHRGGEERGHASKIVKFWPIFLNAFSTISRRILIELWHFATGVRFWLSAAILPCSDLKRRNFT